ncbi:hypothetical protein CRD60_04655 [Bifidobacterium aemilianum]|uniref:4Fe-4S Wbl-type domain-containing protein n=1 Tax=Bifidobacterium aemilianum TaxID=2493120 RepID=A0A366K9N6_9BIFI|nr:WhiB family transcriptional regulator [Bifidobacterium aemilianum]RBP97878.1 hypothetical protein CRD60_04655 [Bifidobacterium aemilianum]
MTCGNTNSAGLCGRFPADWSDKLWGLDETDDSREQADLRRAGKAICRHCPIRGACLAMAIVTGDQHGIYGGLSIHERHQVRIRALAAGIPVNRRDSVTLRKLTVWLRAHPDVFDEAQKQESQARQLRDNRKAQALHRVGRQASPDLQDALFN